MPVKNLNIRVPQFAIRLLICLVIVLSFTSFSGSLALQTNTKPYDYEVKAAFIINFAKFINWQHSAFESIDSPFYIGILGDNPFNSELEKLVSGKKLKGREVRILYFNKFQDFKFCHILFISRSEKKRVKHIFKALKTNGILTISDIENFIEYGGTIGFIMKNKKIRFEINLASANNANLTISSKLLRLAERVIVEAVEEGL
ncbi:DUF4154 domain-containing protein [candidate division KSB1 bacterium]|nr:DUF4154 domain-containing protein [candidate division KSB1 bacterium]